MADTVALVKKALEEKKGFVQTIMTTDTWKLMMFLEFSAGRPDLYFIASYCYKNGNSGSDIMRFVPARGKLVLWQSEGNIRIPIALQNEALRLSELLYSNSSYNQTSVTSYEKLAYSIQNIITHRAHITPNIEDFQQASIDKLAIDVEERHTRSSKIFITHEITNNILPILEKALINNIQIDSKTKQSCKELFRTIKTKDRLLLALVKELRGYINTKESCNNPVGYILEASDEVEINIYDLDGYLVDKDCPEDDGTIILNRLSTIILLSKNKYTGAMVNAQLEIRNKQYKNNIDYLNSIYLGKVRAVTEDDILALVGQINIHKYINVARYLKLIKASIER